MRKIIDEKKIINFQGRISTIRIVLEDGHRYINVDTNLVAPTAKEIDHAKR